VERGLTLAVATSKRTKATYMGLRRCGFPEAWFAGILTANHLKKPKPHPEPLRLALEQAGEREPARAVYVGDSVHDMRSGRAAGVVTAAVLWGPNSRETLAVTGPDRWLEDPAELRGLVELGTS
jgi:pyrophosphatase PpaX